MTAPPLRVLIADDESDLRLVLRLQLSKQSDMAVVGEAADGREAIDFVAGGEVDVVVMDLLMPGINGFQAIDVLQQQHPTVGIVAYTAVAGEYVRAEMQRLGVPLVLKSGKIAPLAAALRGVSGRA